MKRSDLFDTPVIKRAVISPCGRYRYSLERIWNATPPLVFVMLNPSTADASVDDRTIGRCIAFGEREGSGGISVVNLYAFRATDPEQLWTVDDPIGPENDAWLDRIASMPRTGPIVCGWGVNAKNSRWVDVVGFLDRAGAGLACLGKTQDGSPRHPLYVRADQPLEEFP
ncbi:DUF1643 domain-containing protein [Methylosinus sp. Ce-a6]|uniref:DUF1643 domain-containing protein n=1 Tax=Methylosinus sp. Ce-a6 TaxID=2172005 RepID=UPI001914ECBC|nr:DUF1643 domain-containing protein [Methylosinus sp. Ce-a6]